MASASSAEDSRIALQSSHNLKMDTLEDSLPDAWHYRATTRIAWPDVSLRLDEIANLIYNFSPRVLGLLGLVSVYCDWVR